MSGPDSPDKEPHLTTEELAGMVEALKIEPVAEVLTEHNVDPDELRAIFIDALLKTSGKHKSS